jgi:hypothetical protein
MQISISNAIKGSRTSSVVVKLIKSFKTRVALEGGTFEAQSCLKTTLEALDLQYPPLVVEAPVISGDNYAGSTLSTTNGVFDGITPMTYTYQWYLDGSPISGATSSTYTTTGGGNLTCQVKATNSFGSNIVISNSVEITPFILDTYNGAAVAYSLRKLSSSTTNVVRVRRSSDNAEQDFTATQITDGTLTSFCGVGNGFVTTWYDQSGNSNDALQTSALSQPKIYDSIVGLLLENGKPTLEFDGVNDRFTSTITATQPTTYFSLFKGNLISGERQRPFDSIIGRNGLFNLASPSRYSIFAGTSVGISTITTNITQNLAYVLFEGTTSELKINENTLEEISTGTDNLNGLYIGFGGTNYHNGNIQETIIYSSKQSDNRVGIETNINDYYNIY